MFRNPADLPPSAAPISQALEDHLLKTIGVEPAEATPTDLMLATAQVARERLSAR